MLPEVVLVDALRDAVKASFTSGKTEELTVKRLRTIVEKDLQLHDGFFKTHDIWNTKSKRIIQDAVNEHEEDGEGKGEGEGEGEVEKPKPNSPGTLSDFEQEGSAVKQGVKRASPGEGEAIRKRTKLSTAQESKTKMSKGSAIAHRGSKRSSPDIPQEARKQQRTSTLVKADQSGSELSEPPSEVEAPLERPKEVAKPTKGVHSVPNRKNVEKYGQIQKDEEKGLKDHREVENPEKPNGTLAAEPPPKEGIKDGITDDSSELSSVIDEEPPPRKRGRKKDAPPKPAKSKKIAKQIKSTKSTKPKATSASSAADLPVDEAEIKRLQSWLLKCGIRKLWHRELAPYSTPAAKISQLKKMLNDAGMEGRFSVEKAREIKERRELEQDLEAVKEGDKRWGNRNAEDESEEEDKQNLEERPKKRLAKSLQGLDFLNDDDGEETD